VARVSVSKDVLTPGMWQEGREYSGKLELDAVGYTLPAGHILQLLISPGVDLYFDLTGD
jgi:hypothetical protein